MREILPAVRQTALFPPPWNSWPGALPWHTLAMLIGGDGSAEQRKNALDTTQQALDQVKTKNPDLRAFGHFALALAQHMNGDRDRAIEVLRDAQARVRPLALLERQLVEMLLVKYLNEKDDRTAAERVLRDGLKKLQVALPRGDPEIAAAQSRLAAVLVERKAFGGAEPLLLAARETLRTHPQAGSASLKRRLAEAQERLVQLYEAWKRPDEAATWRTKLEEARKREASPKSR